MTFWLLTLLFIGVNLDFFVLLLLLLHKYRWSSVWLGYLEGMLSVFGASALLGQVLQVFVPAWLLGLLGLIPIYLGLKGEADDDDEVHARAGAMMVMLLYLAACGADNLAVYVPVLATLSVGQTLMAAGYFVILATLSLILAERVRRVGLIADFMNRCGMILARVVYVLIGVFVIFESGLLSHFFG